MISERISGFAIRPKLSYREMLANGAALGFSAFFGLLLFLGAAGLVRPLYPAAATVIAAILFAIYRGQYVAFVIWLYMITPFVRRVVDYQAGYQEVSIATLAPQLAASVALLCFFKKLPLLYSMSFLPFLLVLVGVLYGYFVGAVNSGPVAASYDLLLWAVPIAFGFLIASDWRSFPVYRDAIFKVFLWGGAILGAYGIHQYFFLLPWDSVLDAERRHRLGGLAFPASRTRLQYDEFAGAVRSNDDPDVADRLRRQFVDSLPRGAARIYCIRAQHRPHGMARLADRRPLPYGCFARRSPDDAGFGHRRGRTRRNADHYHRRYRRAVYEAAGKSFQDLEEDESFQARSALYGSLTQQALTTFWGVGTGAVGKATKLTSKSQTVVTIDSGFLVVPYVLGWPGAFLMLIGVSWLMLRPPGIVDRRNEVVVQTSTALCVAYIAMMTSYNSMYGVGGILFWTFMGLRLSGRLWSASTPDRSA